MTTIAATGFAIILLAGLLQGLFALPMKFARGWNYENIWLVFAGTGLVIFPWMLTAATVPHLCNVYRATPISALFAILGFGVCWGVGATLTGLGVRMLGIGLGLAVILGLSASVGSLIPLLVLTPEKVHSYQGHIYLAGTAIMLAGIGFGARAGYLREQETAAEMQMGDTAGRSSFLIGLVVVTASGLLSSSLNFCYAFGGAAIEQAKAFGSSPLWASNVITALATTGGFLANLAYCLFLLRRNSTGERFWSTPLRKNWIYGALMGAFWFGGQALYGLGVSRVGDFGTVLGWPLLMGMIIITSNLAGFLTGEWKGTGRWSRGYLALGMVLIICALGVLALGHAK